MSEQFYKPASSEELEQEARDWANRIVSPGEWVDSPEAIPNVEGSTAISLRMPNQMLAILKAFAQRERLGYQVLMKRWLDDRIGVERNKLVEDSFVRPHDIKMVAVATALLEKSKIGELIWSAVTLEGQLPVSAADDSTLKIKDLQSSGDWITDDRFSVDFPESSVSISRTRSADYLLSVLNELGTEVDTLLASKKPEQDPRESGQPIRIPDYYHTLEELFVIAQRTALKPDDVLDNLLARLSADE